MSWMLKEILGQPATLEAMIRQEGAKIAGIAKAAAARKPAFFMLVARGSSDNAALFGKYLFEAHAGVPTVLAAPSIFTVYKKKPALKNGVVIGVSQSGQAPDIIEVLREARKQGAFTIAITNTRNAPICDVADETILLRAGKEKGLAATKTYTAQLMSMLMLSAGFTDDARLSSDILAIPEQVEKTLVVEKDISELSERYRYMEHCVIVGRGYNYSTVKEAALKLMETCYVVAQPFSTADFMHGPIAIAGIGFPTFLCAPAGKMLPQLREMCASLNDKGLETIVISPDKKCLDLAVRAIKMPVSPREIISPMVNIIPFQFFAHYLSGARGLDPDKPRFLNKVTRTF